MAHYEKDMPRRRAFPKLAHTKRTCSSTHPDSRLRGNDGMRFSGQWKGPGPGAMPLDLAIEVWDACGRPNHES